MSIEFHDNFSDMIPHVEAVRDAVSGSIAVKNKAYTYLPHPSQIDQHSASGQARYDTFIAGAEFDDIPAKTMRTMLGKMAFDKSTIELPPQLSYLIDDIDGDGLSFEGALRQASDNILQVKWHLLVSDYQGLSDVDTQELSLDDLDTINPRATIKQYTRDNVVNWSFDRINGAMQLTFIMVREVGTVFNQQSLEHTDIVSYLILALDEEGAYYQQKIVETSDSGIEYGERNYISVNGKSVPFIPVHIATDGEVPAGEMPLELGFLKGVTDLTYARYRVSAEYKEAMRNLPPTTYTSGWTDSDWETFKEINGRDYIVTGSGAVNNLPGEVSVDIVGANTELAGFERYFENNKKAIQAVGGVFSEDSTGNKTATQANMESAEQNAALVDTANGVEIAFTRAVEYCAMFENVTGDITIELNKEFDAVKLSVEEVREVQSLVLSGLITKEQAIKMLIGGGWLQGDAQTLIDEIMEESVAQPETNEMTE